MNENLHHAVSRGESPRVPHQASRERRAKFLATPCAGGCPRLPPASAARQKNPKAWKCARCAKGRPRIPPTGPCAGHEAPCGAMPAKNSLQPADGPWRCRTCASRKAQAELSGDAKARARNGFRQWWAALSEEQRQEERNKRCQLRECGAPGCQERPAEGRAYCSAACRQAGRPRPTPTPCMACGSPSPQGRRTCSLECQKKVAASVVAVRSDACRARRRKEKAARYRRPDKQQVIERLTREQGEACAVCLETVPLVLDHDHATGDPRAMLCRRCNAGFGLMRECPSKIRGLLAYAERYRVMAPPPH